MEGTVVAARGVVEVKGGMVVVAGMVRVVAGIEVVVMGIEVEEAGMEVEVMVGPATRCRLELGLLAIDFLWPVDGCFRLEGEEVVRVGGADVGGGGGGRNEALAAWISSIMYGV